MSILSEIIDWAVEQEGWKQDAIRRIIEKGDYTKHDISEITNILLYQNGYIESAPSPVLIDRSKFSETGAIAKNKVILKKIESPQNINALSSGAKLQFALDGLTIIYGENGTGKSGYSRILKKCCKAREEDSILPNIFTERSSQEKKATIFYSCNGDDKKLEWTDGQYERGELEQLVVHDNKCGKIQVTDENELIYLPNGTDIFKKLINCINEIKTEIQKVKPQKVFINKEKIHNDTQAFKKINSINKGTDKEKIANALQWTEEHDKKLIAASKQIIEANEEEVKKNTTAINKEIQNLKNIKGTIEVLEKTFSKEKITNIFEIKKSKEKFKLALGKITQDMQKEGMLEGTGDELWLIMYSAAQKFSLKSAYKESNYPNFDGQCVLCQQYLDCNAKERMMAFSDFAKGEIKRGFDDIDTKMKESIIYLKELDIKIQSSQDFLNTSFSCLTEDDYEDIKKHRGTPESCG